MGFDVDEFNVHNLTNLLQQLEASRKDMLGEVRQLRKLLLVMPATNAVSEQSFSALKRIKTYLRSTTTNNWLNHMMILHVHKDKRDDLSLIQVANEFVDRMDSRKQVFGKFSDSDTVKDAEFHHVGTQTDE